MTEALPRILLPAAALLVGLTVLACSPGGRGEPAFEEAFSAPAPASRSLAVADAAPASEAGNAVVGGDAPERKRILRASLTLETDDLSATARLARSRTEALEGWVSLEESSRDHVWMTLRIPAARLSAFSEEARDWGRVLSYREETVDVTERWADYEARLENKRILLDRYRAYLQRADTIEDILSVERNVADLTFEIEQLEGAFRGLVRDVDYAVLNLELRLPYRETVSDDRPSFGEGFDRLWEVLARAGYTVVMVLVYAVVLGLPLLALAAGLYVLTFGRIGLLRRLFRALGPGRGTGKSRGGADAG